MILKVFFLSNKVIYLDFRNNREGIGSYLSTYSVYELNHLYSVRDFVISRNGKELHNITHFPDMNSREHSLRDDMRKGI